MPNMQSKNRSNNNTRMQDVGATFSNNKVVKQVSSIKNIITIVPYAFVCKIHIVRIVIVCCKFLMDNPFIITLF